MSTLADLREYVRVQTETTEPELPDATVDQYLSEAFTRTISAETQWPFYEAVWLVDQEPGESHIVQPTGANSPGIVSLVDVQTGTRLDMTDSESAEDRHRGMVSTGLASEFSLWNGLIYLWPSCSFTSKREYRLRGHRDPLRGVDGRYAWLTDPTEELDCDPRLQTPLAHYAIALAYAQQEDEVLESQYMQRWQRDVEIVRRAIMTPAQDRVLGFGSQADEPIGPSRGRGFPSGGVSITPPGPAGAPGPAGPPGPAGTSLVVSPYPPSNLAVGEIWLKTPEEHLAYYGTDHRWYPIWPPTDNACIA